MVGLLARRLTGKYIEPESKHLTKRVEEIHEGKYLSLIHIFQTALDIAEAGYPVDIVEKTPSIGGRMSQLDKTFPTLDCSACILTPKMVCLLYTSRCV